MSPVLTQIRQSVVATLALVLITCGAYPLVVWALAQGIFPHEANGSLIETEGKIIGSELLGQSFSSPGYFQPRPSAAGKGYDAASSGGSNLGPISQKLLEAVKQRAEEYRKVNGLALDALIPADAVTASASGLDPHISVHNAELQTSRVARERDVSREFVRKLVAENTQGPDFGILGEPGVNVLKLNLALDQAAAGTRPKE